MKRLTTPEYCERQYNVRAAIPEHPRIYVSGHSAGGHLTAMTRWVATKATNSSGKTG